MSVSISYSKTDTTPECIEEVVIKEDSQKYVYEDTVAERVLIDDSGRYWTVTVEYLVDTVSIVAETSLKSVECIEDYTAKEFWSVDEFEEWAESVGAIISEKCVRKLA